ncbi:MAG: response regulator, partial [Thermodesulfobacteriota bacterium]
MADILIVDDEEPIRRLLARILERGGYSCATASSCEEAKALMKQGHFPLVLCDVNMPGQSGLDLAREMAASSTDTAVVMVSGVDDPAIAGAALQAGAYGYILKPFNVGDILIQVSNALRRRQLELERKRHFEELEGLVNQRTEELRERERSLREALNRLRRAMDGVIQAMAVAVETRDPYTAGHQQRVAMLALAIGRDMGMHSKSLEAIHMAGVVHDVGKISVPAEIL